MALQKLKDGAEVVPYAWPGGYPVVYIMDDGEILCAECVRGEEETHEDGEADGWRVEGCSIHYEGPPEYCAHCHTEIESAYGDPASDET